MKKCISVLLVSIFVLSVFTGCKRESLREITYVQPEDAWYDFSEVDIDNVYTPETCDSINQVYMAYKDNRHYIYAYGLGLNDEFIRNLDVYSEEGELIETVDFASVLAPGELFFDLYYGDGTFYTYAEKEASSDVYQLSVSVDDLSQIKKEKIEPQVSDDNLVLYKSMYAGGFEIKVYGSFGGYLSSRYLEIKDSTGYTVVSDLYENTVGVQFETIDGIYDVGGSNLLLIGYITGVGNTLYYLNPNSGELSNIPDSDKDWLEEFGITASLLRYSYHTDNNIFVLGDGRVVDFENRTVSEAFSFNNSYLSESHKGLVSAVYASEDSFVFAGELSNMYDSFGKATVRVIKFTKSDSNPNSGKKIIRALNPDMYASDVIADINRSESEFFIRTIDMRAYDFENSAQANSAYRDFLLSSSAPDIVFEVSSSGFVLDDSAYFVDLGDVVDSLEGSYFENVIGSCEQNDKYYRIPISFSLIGLQIENRFLEEGQYGFTYDEYIEFCSSCLNSRPKVLDKVNSFVNTVSDEFDLFYDGEVLDFNCEAFISTAEYYKDNVFKLTDDEFYQITIPGSPLPVGTYYFFDTYLKDLANVRIVGSPTYDGRGPMLSAETVSVTKNTPFFDEAKDIIGVLLSEDMQKRVMTDHFPNNEASDIPVSIGAFEEMARLQIDDFNSDVQHYLGYFGEYSDLDRQLYRLDTVIDYSVITSFEEMCFNACTYNYEIDESIRIALMEEIQPYFAGDKSIEETISILQDRCQTILDERR